MWVIEFEFTSYEVNRIDEIMNIPISPSVSFGQLSLTVDAFHDAAPQGIPSPKVPGNPLDWHGVGYLRFQVVDKA